LTIENKELQRELRVYKRLHDAAVHKDTLFKVHLQSLSPGKRPDLMCLLQDFVADLEKGNVPDIHSGFDSNPSFPVVQRESSTPQDASLQSGSCGCTSMSASRLKPACSSPGCSTGNPAQTRQVPLSEKEAPSLYISIISTDTPRKNRESIANKAGEKVAQKAEPIPSAGHPFSLTSAFDSVDDREASAVEKKGHWKGESCMARWTSNSPLEEHNRLAHVRQSGVTGTQETVTGSEREARTTFRHTSDWTVIFYNQARFFTDLSGGVGSSRFEERNYNRFLANPIGAETHLEGSKEQRRLGDERGPLSKPDTDTVSASGSVSSRVVKDVDLEAFAVEPPCQSSSLSETLYLPDFEVSGLGGVVPSDHFSITIRSCLYARNVNVIHPARAAQHSRPYRRHILRALEDGSSGRCSLSTLVSGEGSCIVVQRDIIDFQVKKLSPSPLPPPSYYEYESSEGDEELGSSDDSTEESE
jgi:hypothetical protein